MSEAIGTTPDPGLAGVVPFRFHCHRCGHCCTAGSGYVWLEDGEVERLAARLDMDPQSFLRLHVREVIDPKTGALRASLTERDGRCSLLEGQKHCSVYEDRPEHCARFPYWPSVIEDEEAFERARSVCPGIAVVPEPEVREEAFDRLRALYAEVDDFVESSGAVCIGRGVCCRFEEAGHELFATALEADYSAALHETAAAPEAPGRCPHHVEGRCTAREGRPLGCRTYFCDRRTTTVLEEAHEHFLARIRQIERECRYPVAYGRFPELLAARGIGQEPSSATGEGKA